MIILSIVCHVIIGVSTNPCNFIISTVTMMVKMAMATKSPNTLDGGESYDANQCSILEQLPTSLYTAFKIFNNDGRTTIYATCPSCNFTHKPSYDRTSAIACYPSHCINRILGPDGSNICGTPLLETRASQLRPVKPYLVASFADYLARILSDPEVERCSDQACDDAKAALHDPPRDTTNIFHAEYMKTFDGPVCGQLFIDRGNKVRLGFAMHVDFFNLNGTRKRGNHDSIGIISLALLNLPDTIRYLPENIYLAVIPGPHEPIFEEINYFTRPVIDELEIAWGRGIHISQTALSPDAGHDVEAAIMISINDLPAARKVSGNAGMGSHFYCTVCSGYGRDNLYNTDFNKWALQDVTEMRQHAVAWRDADTVEERGFIFEMYGIRWSELWRLPYWDPMRMLVVDSMHCMLEGIVHYHCHHVLGLDTKQAVIKNPLVPVFSYPWPDYSPDVPEGYRITHDREIQHIREIHGILTLPFKCDMGSTEAIDEIQLQSKLLSKNLKPLKFVCYTLNLREVIMSLQGPLVPAKTKKHFAQLLINWVG
jgi:hypothetical protein